MGKLGGDTAVGDVTDIGKVGRNHPQTSVVASYTPRKGTQKAILLQLVTEAGEFGITCYEASKEMDMAPNQVATRMMELREADLVWRAWWTRPTTPGNSGHVHLLMRYRRRRVRRV